MYVIFFSILWWETTTEDCKYTKLDTQFVGSSWQYIPSYGVVVTAQVTEYYPPFTPKKEVKLPDIPPTPPLLYVFIKHV